MKILVFCSLIYTTTLFAGTAVQIIVPKASEMDSVASAYDGTWQMLNKIDDEWLATAIITENLSMDDDGVWHHLQVTEYLNKAQPVSKVSRILRENDYFTEQLVLDIIDNKLVTADSAHDLKTMMLSFANKSATQRAILRDESEHQRTFENLPFNGFDGFILGLVLSGFELRDNAIIRLPVYMFSQQFSPYWVDAHVHKTDNVVINGSSKKLWQLDTRWLDVSSGSVSPKGPDESGGSYYIFQNPDKNQPAVYRYKNNTVDITLK